MSASPKLRRSHVPAWVPSAQGRITHDVTFDHPRERGHADLSETVPVCSEIEGRNLATRKRSQGMRNVRVVPRPVVVSSAG